ncbi:hypothetical protein Pcinc_016651 [Petrolisthes cinctipes]|uniref:Uncharacterized protein n=1 Tax=Petrolisthes cinctipes TaxID=88211 RepID=A0AAE1FS09_PETCI|nr:hypothetical protein Pcinc_016651 [Petrolisthes cinctipes]
MMMMMMMVMVMVMVLALTPPVDAGIRTECPAYNQSSMVPQQPLEMNKIGEHVLEARFQLSPPPDNNTTFKWEKQPKYLKKKGGECWVELSTNNDEEEENQKLMDHMCPFNLPEFPQLQLTVKCPDNVEQCATINFCNTGLCWSCVDSLEYHTTTQHHQYHTQDYKVVDEGTPRRGRESTKSYS